MLYFEFNTRPHEISKPIITDKTQDDYEIEVFREYLRIPSVHPNIDYGKYVSFLLSFDIFPFGLLLTAAFTFNFYF